MGGRIYDPDLGRFLQADPHVQAPSNTQNYNRYSYVLNNPMSYTDPSGFFFKKLFKAIGGNRFVSSLISIGLAFTCGPACSAAFNAAVTYAVTGSLKAAAIGAFASLASPTGMDPLAFLARGIIGGIASKAQGGKFGHGFIAAGASGLAGGIKNIGVRIMASAVIGGTVSKITGGKFANGASSAAFATLVEAGFNGELKSSGKPDAQSSESELLFATEGTAEERQRRFDEITEGHGDVEFEDYYVGVQLNNDGTSSRTRFDSADEFQNWLSTSPADTRRAWVNAETTPRYVFGFQRTSKITMYRSSVMAKRATTFLPGGGSYSGLRSYFDAGLMTFGHELGHRVGLDIGLQRGAPHLNANQYGLDYCLSRGGCNGY